MKLFGIHNAKYPIAARDVFDAPCVVKGKSALCAEDIATSCELMAVVIGCIRNASELKKELMLSAKASYGSIVIAAYRKHGAAFYERITGACACVLIDTSKGLMVLSRDRMGERRMFFAEYEYELAFSDSPDALLESGHARRLISARGLNELFALGPARTPGATPYEDIHELEAGCALHVEGYVRTIKRYFSLTSKEHEDTLCYTIEKTRALIEQAAYESLSLKPAVMLSGGLDSTALTALYTKKLGRLLSYSVDYEGNDRHFTKSEFLPERDAPYIEKAVEAFDTEHTNVMLTQNALAAALKRAVDARGFPGMADIDSSLLLFAEAIGARSRYVISGECGDEVFGGYPWFKNMNMLRTDVFPWSGSVALRESILKKHVREKLNVRGYVKDALLNALAGYDAPHSESVEETMLRNMQRLCFDYFMPNLQERALTMCEACEVCVITPYADERLAEYVFNVPWSIKNLGGMEKGLLRAATRDIMPESLNMRKKSPYPKTVDPEYTRIALRMTGEMLRNPSSPILQIIDTDELERIAGSTLSPTETPWFGQLMAGAQMLMYIWQVNTWLADRRIVIDV